MMLSIKIKHKSKLSPTRILKGMDGAHQLFLGSMIKLTIEMQKKFAPVGQTGELKKSINVLNLQSRGDGGLNRNFVLGVGPGVEYAKYVIKGTKESEGRFVPEIGKRVVNGLHPGIRPNDFVEKASIAVQAAAPGIGALIYGRWEKDWQIV